MRGLRIGLQQGVYSGAAQLIGAGLVVVAPSSWMHMLGVALLVAGIGLGVWGLRFHGHYWWAPLVRRMSRSSSPPCVYVRNTEARQVGFSDKIFRIDWIEESISLVFRGEGSDGFTQGAPREPTMTFELFNASDEPARHIVAQWRLSGPDIADDVALLGPNVRSFENGKLKMTNGKGGSVRPVTMAARSEPHPVLKSGEAVQIFAPESFTTAYSIRALGRAKRQSLRVSQRAGEIDPLEILEEWGEPMDPAFIDLSYIIGGEKRQHSFAVIGRVFGAGQAHIPRTTDGGDMIMDITPGIVAVVDHVRVIHHEG